VVKPARNNPKKMKHKRRVMVEDQRPIGKILPRSSERGNPNIPIRTVLYLEVQDLPAADVKHVAEKILHSFPNEHPHYFVPVRFGKLTTEFEFEGEFLKTVNKLCEVKDGKIVLKGGATEMDVIRKKIH